MKLKSKKRNLKRAVISIAVVALVLTMFQAPLMAETNEGTLSTLDEATIVEQGKQGTCGSPYSTYVSWTLSDDGTLTFKGSGRMVDYNYNGGQKWTKELVKKVVIDEGITHVGNYMFSDCVNLESVEIPSSLQKKDKYAAIGQNAFRNCSSLTSVVFNENSTIESIEQGTFSGCSSLKSINIPESVTTIDSEAFKNCSSLESISIPANVTSIDTSAFENCSSLSSLTVDQENTTYDSRNDCNGIVETESNTLILGCAKTVIPEDVTTIGDSAFANCSSLTNVNFADDSQLESIESSAFSGCVNLSSVNLPESVTSIGDYAFTDCTSLESFSISSNISSLGEGAFANCSSLKNVEFAEDCQIDSINTSTFSECGNLESMTIPSSVTSIEYNAFENCSKLNSVVIPEGVTEINDSAFSGCSSLESVAIPEGVTQISDSVFLGCSGLKTIKISSGVDSIGDNAFSGCSGLEEITVDEENSTYDSRENCNAIINSESNSLILGCKNTKIPEKVTSIYDSAFSGCTGLTELTLPSEITDIGANAFFECTGLKSINIPASVENIGESAFAGCCGLESITVDSANKTFDSRDNCNAIILKSSRKLILGCASTVIPSSVLTIGENAFYKCTNLTSINIPYGIGTIGNSAFYGCSNLKEAVIPKSVTSISDNAFSECDENLTICGLKGTSAEKYATRKGMTFVCNHNLVKTDVVEATCTEDGNSEYWTCSGSSNTGCGKYFSDAEGKNEIEEGSWVIPAGHKPADAVKENVKEATCTEKGSYDSVVYCSVCKEELSRETVTVPAKGHSLNSGVVTKKATATANGTITYTCKVCKKVIKTTTIKKATILTAKVATKTVTYAKAKKKAQTLTPITAKSGVGAKITYKVTKYGNSKAKKYLSLNTKTGKVTVKKKTPKGTYKIKVKVSAAATTKYAAASKTVTVTIKVK